MNPAIAALLEKAGLEGGAIDDFLVPVAVRGVPEMLAKKAGIGEGAVADSLGATLGHAGAAHALVMLAAALESAQAGERILLASFGQGCELLLFEVTARSEEHTSELQSLMRNSYAVFCLKKK